VNSLVQILLTAAGAVLVLVGLLGDALGISAPGFGPTQLVLVALGVVALVAGSKRGGPRLARQRSPPCETRCVTRR